MKNKIFIVVAMVVGLGAYFLFSKDQGDAFLRQQAVQSALFPALGPLLQEQGAQPVRVIVNEKAFGVVVNLKKPISDHSERENYRAKLTVAIREWSQTHPELNGLQSFVTFQDELQGEYR